MKQSNSVLCSPTNHSTTVMKFLATFVCLLGVARSQYWGHEGVHDTPEVEAAKAAHFSAHAKALARLGHSHSWSGDHGSSWELESHHEAPHHADHWEEPQPKWTGPIALPPGYDKHGAPLPVHDTPEVEAEKAKHFYLYSHGAYAGAHAHSGHESHSDWSTPDHHSEWSPSSSHY